MYALAVLRAALKELTGQREKQSQKPSLEDMVVSAN